jgi:hypothetical protein
MFFSAAAVIVHAFPQKCLAGVEQNSVRCLYLDMVRDLYTPHPQKPKLYNDAYLHTLLLYIILGGFFFMLIITHTVHIYIYIYCNVFAGSFS